MFHYPHLNNNLWGLLVLFATDLLDAELLETKLLAELLEVYPSLLGESTT